MVKFLYVVKTTTKNLHPYYTYGTGRKQTTSDLITIFQADTCEDLVRDFSQRQLASFLISSLQGETLNIKAQEESHGIRSMDGQKSSI